MTILLVTTVKPVLSGLSKIDKMKVIKTGGSLENLFLSSFAWLLKTGLTVHVYVKKSSGSANP